MNAPKRVLSATVCAILSSQATAVAAPMGTAFTYQGQLKQAGVPVDGQADFRFRLYDAQAGGTLIDNAGFAFVDVVDGLFHVELDFGAAAFDGSARWLEIEVEFPSGEGNWTTLSPRQPIRPAPYALYSTSGPGAAGEYWAANGGNIYNTNAGNVGIGTSTPSALLHVTGDASRTARFRNEAASGGVAVAATATGRSGYATAVDAYVANPTGVGVYSFNEAESGNAYALEGETSSPAGVAVYGFASNDNEYSTGIGVYGKSAGDYGGTGVYGEATNTGTTYGVRGVSQHGTGARGENTDTGNFGLLGSSTASVFGRTMHDAHTAVKGEAVGANAFSGYFTGGRNYFEGNVGIGTDAPTSPLHLGRIGNWHWTLGNGWGDLSINNGDHGVSLGVHPDYALAYLWTTGENERLRIGNATDGVILAIENDAVGIGTISPTETLDVMGNALIHGSIDVNGLVDADDLKVHGATANGWVLTSDANGNGTWQPPVSGDGVWSVSGTDISYTAGNVGIGTTTPDYSLDIDGKVLIEEIEDVGVGWIRTVGANGEPNAQITYLDGFPDHGYVSAKNAGGYTLAGIYVDHEGHGVVSGDIKSFRVPHPDDPETDIWYACVEGPEAAMYVRGTGQLVDGRATIRLPDHFRVLAVEDSMTVQLTPKSFDSKGLAVGHQTLDGIEVGELNGGRGNYEFHWEVKAVRRAHQDFKVIRPWNHARAGGDPSPEKLWATRLRWIERREQRIREMEARLSAKDESEDK